MDLIKQATKDCEREDCCIYMGGGMSTCMAWTPTYDKNGNRIDSGDPNTHTQSIRCTTCSRHWTASTRKGETTLYLHDQQSEKSA